MSIKVNTQSFFLSVLVFFSIIFRRLDELFSLPGGTESRIYFMLNLILFFYLIYKKRITKKRLEPEVKALILWFIWLLITFPLIKIHTPLNDFWAQVRNSLLSLLTFINLFYLINPFNFRVAVKTFIFSVLLLAVLIFFDTGTFNLNSISRLGGNSLEMNTNELGYFVVLATSLLFIDSGFFNNKIKGGILFYFLFLVIILASRKAFIGIIVFFLFFYGINYMLIKKNKLKKIILLITTFIMIMFFVEFTLKESFLGERMMRTTSLDDFKYIEYQKAEHYENFLPLLKKYPIIGVGLGNTIAFSSFGKGSHSEYISIINETGIVGALLYFSVYYFLFIKLLRYKKKYFYNNTVIIGFIIGAINMLLLYSIGRWNYSTPAHFTYIIFLFKSIDYYYYKELIPNRNKLVNIKENY